MSESDAIGKSWMLRAACFTDKSIKPEIFFPPKGNIGSEAKKVCGICPVRVECLEFAFDNDENDGVWGGKTPNERRSMRRNSSMRPYSSLSSTRPRYTF